MIWGTESRSERKLFSYFRSFVDLERRLQRLLFFNYE